jgi:hypothetical protein
MLSVRTALRYVVELVNLVLRLRMLGFFMFFLLFFKIDS